MRTFLFLVGLTAFCATAPARAANTVPHVITVDTVKGRVYGFPPMASAGVIYVYDERDLALVTTVPVGTAIGVASPVDSERHRFFVVDPGTQSIVAIDTDDFTTQAIPVGVAVSRLLLDPVSHRLWALSPATNTIVAIADDLSSQSLVLAGLNFFSGPQVDVRNDRLVSALAAPSDTLTTIAGADMAVGTIPIGEIASVYFAIDPTRDRIYVGLPSSSVGVDPPVDARVGVLEADALAQEIPVPGTEMDLGFPPDVRLANPVGDEVWMGSGIFVASASRLRLATQVLSRNWGAVPELFDVVANKFTHDEQEGDVVDAIVDIDTKQEASLGNSVANALDPLRSRIFGASTEARVFDHARTSTTTIATGFGPGAVAIDPIANRIFVANRADDSVTVIDGATRSAQSVVVGDDPAAIAVNPATGRAYTANHLGDSVTVIDGATLATATIAAGDGPIAIAVNAAANRIYAVNQLGDSVTVIEGGDGSTRTVAAGHLPSAVAVDPVAGRAYVTNSGSGSVTVLMGSDLFAFTRAAGVAPGAVAVDATRKCAWVTNLGGNSVTRIGSDLTTQTIAVGIAPSAVALDAVTGRVFVANRAADTVTAIDPATFATTPAAVGDEPVALAVDPATHFVYVANRLGNSISRLDPIDLSARTFATGVSPLAIAANPVTQRVYAANYLSTNATEVDDFVAAPIPLTTAITSDPPEPSGTVALDLAATNGFPALPIQNIFVQLDDRAGPWTPATLAGDAATFTTAPLAPGLHVARAWASIGLEASAAIPIPGSVAAHPLVVPEREGTLSIELASTLSSVPPGGILPLDLSIGNDHSTLQSFALFLLLVGPGGTPSYPLASGLPLTFPSSMEFRPTINLPLPADAASGTWTIGGAVVQAGVGIVDQALLTFQVP